MPTATIIQVFVDERRLWIGRAVEERLPVHSASLLELLLHLVGHHLLAQPHLTHLNGTMIVVIITVMDASHIVHAAAN